MLPVLSPPYVSERTVNKLFKGRRRAAGSLTHHLYKAQK